MLDTDRTVTIGKGHASKNKVVVKVKNRTGAEARLLLSLQVKCGTSADALLASKDAPATFEYQGPSDSKPIEGRPVDLAENGKRKWETKSKGIKIENEATISLNLRNVSMKMRHTR
jgi:hypothetical protein